MEIHVRDRKLKAALEDDAVCQRKFGKEMAHRIRLLMDALHGADSLHDFWPPKSRPERIHELQGKLSGTYSGDLKHPYRLLFKPTGNDQGDKQSSDMEKLWKGITSIEILRVEDTHG